MRRKASPWQRNLGYPLAMLALLALTVYINPDITLFLWAQISILFYFFNSI